MRLTVPLSFPQRMKRLKDASWQRWRKQRVTDTGAETVLRQVGVSVYDANEFVRVNKDTNPLFIDYDAIPAAKPLFPQPPKFDRSHPDWQETPCRIFDDSSFPIEGLRQAQAFAKCVQIKQGLPDSVMELGFSTKLPNQDDRIQHIIKQAFLYDAYMEKLPNLRNLDIEAYTYRVKFGTPLKRANDIMMRKMIKMIEGEVLRSPIDRIISGEHQFRLNMRRHDSLVQFKLSPLITMFSKSKPKPFVDHSESAKTSDSELPSIEPFLSTANIEDSNIYKTTDYFAFQNNNPFPYIDTMFFSHHIPGSYTHVHPPWNDDRFAGTTAMYAFATSLLMVKEAHGTNVKSIEEPVTTKVVHFTGKELQFAIFQLNTMDLEQNSGSQVKNILWITEKIPLFNLCRYKWGKELFEGYNPDAFKILLGLCASNSQL